MVSYLRRKDVHINIGKHWRISEGNVYVYKKYILRESKVVAKYSGFNYEHKYT